MLYICIPAHNEAPTIGVLLWRLRAALQEFSREYEVVVYDDGSTDETLDVLEPYKRVLPLTVLAGRERLGLGAALDALARHVASHTRYPRRDAMIVMEGDFTDRPEHIPELVKRFEGGADLVVTERRMAPGDPVQPRRLRRVAPWILRPFVKLDGVADATSTYRLIRISALRDLLRDAGDRAVVTETGWAANAQLLLALAPYARRIESVPVEPRYEVRPRESRVRALADALALARFAWRSRGGKGPVVTARPVPVAVPVTAPSGETAAPEPPLSLADAPPARRRKRPRPDGAEAPRLARPPRDESAEERAERRERRRERREREALVEPVLAAPGEAPEPAESDGAAAPPKAKKRRRKRGAKRAIVDGVMVDASPDSAPAPDVSPDAEQITGPDAGPDAARDPLDASDESAAPTRSRRRRSRKRRSAATSDGAAPTGGSEAPGDAPGEAMASDASSGAEGGEGEPGAPRARRSRRGRRRGTRGAATASEAPSTDAGEHAAPAPEPHGDTP